MTTISLTYTNPQGGWPSWGFNLHWRWWNSLWTSPFESYWQTTRTVTTTLNDETETSFGIDDCYRVIHLGAFQ